MPNHTRPFCFLEWLLRSTDVSIRNGNRVTTWPLPLPDQIDPPELGEEFTDLFDRTAEVARNAHSAWDEFSLDTILTSLHMPGLNMALALSLRDWCEYRRTFDPGMWRPDLEAAAELFIVNPGAHPGREVDFARQA